MVRTFRYLDFHLRCTSDICLRLRSISLRRSCTPGSPKTCASPEFCRSCHDHCRVFGFRDTILEKPSARYRGQHPSGTWAYCRLGGVPHRRDNSAGQEQLQPCSTCVDSVLALLASDRAFVWGSVVSGQQRASGMLLSVFLQSQLFCVRCRCRSLRPAVAHSAALMGIVSVPWLYRDLVRGNGLGETVWLIFNRPNDTYGMYVVYLPYAVLGICAVALIALALTTAFLRLLPSQWEFRKTRLAERTWPALAVSFIVLGAWFSHSVLPYRIPGTVDYSEYPVLQILHIEKRGLQFHERCFSVYWRRPYLPASVSFSGSNRRLFQYRFQDYGSSLQLPKALGERVQAFVESSAHEKRQRDVVKPIWNWNADRWYFSNGSGLREYDAFNGSNPPQAVIDLFRELDGIPRYSETQSELRDVCLGFCYDPLSAMGWLYSNHRCFNDGHGDVCR